MFDLPLKEECQEIKSHRSSKTAKTATCKAILDNKYAFNALADPSLVCFINASWNITGRRIH